MTKQDWWNRSRAAIAKFVGNNDFEIGDVDLYADTESGGDPQDASFVVAFATNGVWKVYCGPNSAAEQWEGI